MIGRSALAIVTTMTACGLGPALAGPTYAGPAAIRSEAYGALAPRQERIVNLVTGKADSTGTCRAAAPCDPKKRRSFTVSRGKLAKLRALTLAVSTQGLFDTACVARRQRDADAQSDRPIQDAMLLPPFKPLSPDLFWTKLTVDGLGTVTHGPDIDSSKPEVSCASSSANALWDAIDALRPSLREYRIDRGRARSD